MPSVQLSANVGLGLQLVVKFEMPNWHLKGGEMGPGPISMRL